jgi:hypothetical protein
MVDAADVDVTDVWRFLMAHARSVLERGSASATIVELALLLEARTKLLGSDTFVAIDNMERGRARRHGRLDLTGLVALLTQAAAMCSGVVPTIVMLNATRTSAIALIDEEHEYLVVGAERQQIDQVWHDADFR